jgi:hypothetical protein
MKRKQTKKVSTKRTAARPSKPPRKAAAISAHAQMMADMSNLEAEIEREIETVESDMGHIPGDFAEVLCQRFADGWNVYNEDGSYPQWLMWVVVGILAKHGVKNL